MATDRPTHVRGFATIIRLIGPSLLGNIAFSWMLLTLTRSQAAGAKVSGVTARSLWHQHLFMANMLEKLLRALEASFCLTEEEFLSVSRGEF